MRLIDADELKKELSDKDYITYTHEFGEAIPVDWIMSAINNAPTVEERLHGKWIDHSEDEGYLECPICGCLTNCYKNKEELNFCWHCGADMSKEAKNE